jgi:hypothetical protein
MDEETILHELNVPHQMAHPLNKIRIHEVEHLIRYKVHSKNATRYDLITGKMLQELCR